MSSSVDSNSTDKQLLKELTATIRATNAPLVVDVSEDKFITKMQREMGIKFISRHEYRHLAGLYQFMVKHPELKDKYIGELIGARPIVFYFLNSWVSSVRDFLPELRKYGVQEMAVEIAKMNAVRMCSDELINK